MLRGKRSRNRSRTNRTKVSTLFSAVSIELLGLIIFLMLLSAVKGNHSPANTFANPQHGLLQAQILPPSLTLSEYHEYSADRVFAIENY